MHTFGQTLRYYREKRGMSREELAKAAGVTRQAVYNLESDHYQATFSTAFQLARALGLGVDKLVPKGWL